MTRDEALARLEESPYPSKDGLETDKKYFLKKMGWDESTLKAYIDRPEKRHDEYPSDRALWDGMKKIYHEYIRKGS